MTSQLIVPTRRSSRSWSLVWAGVRTRLCACTGCGSRSVRRSSVTSPIALRLFGMRLWRCRDCGALFPLTPRAVE